MASGTKVFLATSALLLGALVLYYTVIGDTTPPPLELDASPVVDADEGSGATGRSAAADPQADLLRRTVESVLPPAPEPAVSLDRATAERRDDADRGGAVGTPAAAATRLAANPGRPVNVEDAPAPLPPPAPLPIYDDYEVRPGDTLSAIAARTLGNELAWQRIADANPGVDPSRLKVGSILRIPRTADTGAAPAPVNEGEYVVRPGDTLSLIAGRRLGDPERWREIHALNRDLLGSDPHRLDVGMVLRMPAR